MDSVELVIAALTVGAAAGFKDTATSAVKDAYRALIAAARRSVGRRKADAATVVDAHAVAPELHRAELIAALTAANAGDDVGLVAAAQKLLALVDLERKFTGMYQVDALGSGDVQVGDHGTINKAHTIYSAHTINKYEAGTAPSGGVANGIIALRAGVYDVAISQLNAALQAQPSDANVHYYLTLARLSGRRPHQIRSQTEISTIRQHLALAGSLAHARLLGVLVEEDCGRHWERRASVSDGLLDLIRSVELNHIAEIAKHVPAPENRVWELLNDVLRSGEK